MMTLSSNCSKNMQPSPSSLASSSSPPPRPKTTSQVALPKAERVSHTNKSWTNKFVVGVACMIISLDAGKFVDDGAMAGEIKAVVQSKDQIMQWSSKRKCAPWRLNSLETIVPENLPRPSARRRWENVDYAKVNAPAVKFLTNLSSKCFSM